MIKGAGNLIHDGAVRQHPGSQPVRVGYQNVVGRVLERGDRGDAVKVVDESCVHKCFNTLQERIEVARWRIQSVKVYVERKRSGVCIKACRPGDIKPGSKPLSDS